MRKGVSPLIAVIMLIAVTMIVAGIVVTWTEQFATHSISEIRQCSEAKAVIQTGSYNAGTLNLIIQNYGKVDLTFSIYITDNSDAVTKLTNNFTINSMDMKTATFTGVTSDLREVTIQSNECPGVQDLLQYFYIKGL